MCVLARWVMVGQSALESLHSSYCEQGKTEVLEVDVGGDEGARYTRREWRGSVWLEAGLRRRWRAFSF